MEEAEFRKLRREVDEQKDRTTRLALDVKRNPYEIAHGVLKYLAIIAEFGTSGEEYQKRLVDIAGVLRTLGRGQEAAEPSSGKFLLGFADLIEEENRPGLWPGLKDR